MEWLAIKLFWADQNWQEFRAQLMPQERKRVSIVVNLVTACFMVLFLASLVLLGSDHYVSGGIGMSLYWIGFFWLMARVEPLP